MGTNTPLHLVVHASTWLPDVVVFHPIERLRSPVARSAALAAGSHTVASGLPPTLLHSVGGLAVVLVVKVLNVVKPRGLTPYGLAKAAGRARPA